VRAYSEKVFFHALSFVKTWHQAEEVTQDIFLHIWQKRHKLSEVDHWENYLFVVSKNYLLSSLRKTAYHAESLEDDFEVAMQPASTFENKELGALLERAISNLPEQKAQVFRLIHQDGLSQEEVGQKLGIATRTVRWNLVAAVNGIKDFLHRFSISDLYLLLLLAANFLKKG
jgi:RNA polymerase sigma-70 factor (ECF subfamily)